MVKTTFYLEAEIASALQRIARSQRRSRSEVIREVLARFAGAMPPPAPQGIGGYRSGRPEVGAKAEEIQHRRTRD